MRERVTQPPARTGEGSPNGNEPGPGTTPSSVPAHDELRTLLVDDHASVLRFLSFAFSSNGCAVTTAARAEEALELVGQQSFDLVVSDIKMPGLSGLDLLQAVKDRHADTPVVLITGAPSVETAVFGLRHQAFDYLTKPFSAEQVQELLQRVRSDRQKRREQSGAPANLTQELARRQLGMEMLSRIGSLAFQGLDTAVFVDKVIDHLLAILTADAAAVLLSDDDGDVTVTQKGDPALAARLVTQGRQWLRELQPAGAPDGTGVISITEPFVALATLIPGDRKATGLLCVGRHDRAQVLPDEKEFVTAYAATVGMGLQRLMLSENLEETLIDTIASFVNALESKDPYLKGHSARVSLYAGEIAKAMALPAAEVGLIRRAGILHDLGKLVVLDSILQKPARLTPEEFTQMQGHPVNAAKILKPLRFLAQEAEAIKRHHERYDGKGYPDGLKGDEIPLAARIVTVADSFDAMTSNRPYRAAMPLETAMEEIVKHSEAQFDPVVIEGFRKVPLSRLNEISRFYDNRPEPFPDSPAKPDEATDRPRSFDTLAAAWSRLTAVNGLAPGTDIASRMAARHKSPSSA